MKQKVLGIIPSRFASTRLPGKPLIMLDGKTMVQMVWERVREVVEEVVVATDDERIARNVEQFGGRVILTQPGHPSGTDRCAEAAGIYNTEADEPADIILNIQGDEPFLKSEQLVELIGLFKQEDTQIATLIRPCMASDEIFDPNQPKVVVDKNFNALYFSRSAIPYNRTQDPDSWMESGTYYKHIGLYGFRSAILMKLSTLEKTPLEKLESLEQLRWLEHGYEIRTAVSKYESMSIDTMEDLLAARQQGLIESYTLPG
jgi:3-deoxy-manno-octulosonate cytidylyltransferase (CMP-KDO synthetase)